MATRNTRSKAKKKSHSNRNRPSRSRSSQSAMDKVGAYLESKFADFEQRMQQRFARFDAAPAGPSAEMPPVEETEELTADSIPEPTPAVNIDDTFPPGSITEVAVEDDPDDAPPKDKDDLVALANKLFVAAQGLAHRARLAAEQADAAYVEQKRLEREAGKSKAPDPFAALTPDDIAFAMGACGRSYAPRKADGTTYGANEKQQAWEAPNCNRVWVMDVLRNKKLITGEERDAFVYSAEKDAYGSKKARTAAEQVQAWPYAKVEPLIRQAIDYTRLGKAAEPKLDDREQTEVEKTLFELEFDLDPDLAPTAKAA